MREIASLAQLKDLLGQEVGVSDWVTISQARVNTFADATDDHQWIHLDVERAKLESPYGGTIAHGYLTLSLLPMLISSTLSIGDVKMGINYGLNKLRFPAPVPVGSAVRARFTLLTDEAIAGGSQTVWQVTMERQGGDKPVCIAEVIYRYYL